MAVIMEPSEMRAALNELRTRRRIQRLTNIDWIDTLYRAYVVGISLIAALATLAAVVGDTPVGTATLDGVRERGPAIAGALVATLIALGLRSGAHGGPLAFEAADVQQSSSRRSTEGSSCGLPRIANCEVFSRRVFSSARCSDSPPRRASVAPRSTLRRG